MCLKMRISWAAVHNGGQQGRESVLLLLWQLTALTDDGSGPGGVLGPTADFDDAADIELCNVTRREGFVGSEDRGDDKVRVGSESAGDSLSSVSEATAFFDFKPLSLLGVLSADATFFFLDFLRVGGGDPSPSLRAVSFGDLLFFVLVLVEWWCWFVDEDYIHKYIYLHVHF